MHYHLQTEHSYLGSMPIENSGLVQRCVLEIEGQLIERPFIQVYGKLCRQQRNVGFFSNTSVGYHYSGQLAASKPLTPALQELLDSVNATFESDFNGILVNEYPDGEHCIGKHSDDETALSNKGVVCVSYGASRKFRIRDKKTGKPVLDIPTESGSMLIMGGQFQREFTHEIPVEKKIKERRISFTFRKHLV